MCLLTEYICIYKCVCMCVGLLKHYYDCPVKFFPIFFAHNLTRILLLFLIEEIFFECMLVRKFSYRYVQVIFLKYLKILSEDVLFIQTYILQ